MKETKAYLKDRWQSELNVFREKIDLSLKKGRQLSKKILPKTAEGLIDLRGYSTPKEYKTERSNSGKTRKYVNESLRIRGVDFSNIDLSYTDFERCIFHNCQFNNSNFRQARFVATDFWGCKFQNITFDKTDFGYSSFDNGLFGFRRDSFSKLEFRDCNFSECSIYKQRFKSCVFINCRTGGMSLNRCELDGIKFVGNVKNLFITNSKKVGVDFKDAYLIGINIKKQTLEGFEFPYGDNYFMFTHKTAQLNELPLFDNLSNDQISTIESIKRVWLHKEQEIDFVDINWLNDNEIEAGKLLINKLKTGGNSAYK